MRSSTARRRATIVDVASAAGVSRQTVSNVLNFPDRVRPRTRDRVLAEVDRLGYRPSTAARGLRNQRAGAVGLELNLPTCGSDIGPLVLGALTARAPAHDVHLVPFGDAHVFPTVAAYRDMTRRHLVDAFVFADTHSGDPRPDWLLEHEIPFAAFGRLYSHPELTCWADVDGHRGLELAVEHLVDRGYATVGYLGWPLHLEDPAVAEDRHRGWVDAATGLGVAGPAGVTDQQLGPAVEAADALLNELGPGDAVACASDLIALAVLYAAARRGLAVGRDLGVVGFDGSLVARRHGLTTVVQPYEDLADHLLRTVHDQLLDGTVPVAGALLDPTLAPSSSTDRESELTSYTPVPAPTRR
ncbi:LacI family DNA-binding transcriptional regulator [Ornithinimicrobium cerasi]|uniref:LacI family DNA-binding transcriptional regulator n=1 Tax=Ornithinimicrobium cerasi TaxID=2248773 RepID=UPI00137A177F|nr:LacI family DNA-binding transcriptional regulator [Ornithinimicrobium cerasi]